MRKDDDEENRWAKVLIMKIFTLLCFALLYFALVISLL